VGEDGTFNVAPYSWVTPVIVQRPLYLVGASTDTDGKERDTLINVRYSKDFVINLVSEDMAEAMIITSTNFPIEVDEFKEAGLTPVKADLVTAPLVAESPVSMECKLERIQEFGELPWRFCLIFGEVVRVHVNDAFYVDGKIQASKYKALGKLGGDFYCWPTDIFEMKRRTIDNIK